MKIRHEDVKGQPINTIFGLIQIDQHGFVTNFQELGVKVGDSLIPIRPEDLLKCPGFLNAELFPPDGVDMSEIPEVPETSQQSPQPVQVKKVLEDKDYWVVIEELSQGGDNLNSEGLVNMDILTAKLKELGMSPISGTRRREITKAFKTF